MRVEQLYAVRGNDLSPIIDALRRLDLEPYQCSYPRVWPNNLAAPMAIPPATTGADGRFTLRGVGRDRQANLAATGPGMAPMQWTVLNRDDATEVTAAVRARWPHTGQDRTARKWPRPRPTANPGVQVYGPTFDLRVDPAPTIAGRVRDAMSGRPVRGPSCIYSSNGSRAAPRPMTTGTTGSSARMAWTASGSAARPPDGAPLLGAAREFGNVQRLRRVRGRLRAPSRRRRLRPGRRAGDGPADARHSN